MFDALHIQKQANDGLWQDVASLFIADIWIYDSQVATCFQGKRHTSHRGRQEQICRCLPDKQAVTPWDPHLSALANWLVIDQLKDSLIYGEEDLRRQPPGREQRVMNVRSRPWGTRGCSLGGHTSICNAPPNWHLALRWGVFSNLMNPNNFSEQCVCVCAHEHVAGVCSGRDEWECCKGRVWCWGRGK